MLPLCCCSLAHSHLSQSGVRNDHRVNKRPAAAHLPHLLRHACHHGRLLCLPDQVSQGFLSLFLCYFFFPCQPLFYCSNPLCVPQARSNFCFPVPEQTEENNILGMVTLYLQHTFNIMMDEQTGTYNQGYYILCNSYILFSSLDRFLNQAMKMFDATEVVPINFVFFTASAIVAGMS